MGKIRILDLNLFTEFLYISSSMRFPHVSTQFCKKNDSKDLVYAGKVVIVFYVLKISKEIR